MAVGNERQDQGVFEGVIPNKSYSKLLLAVLIPGNGEVRIPEQRLQRGYSFERITNLESIIFASEKISHTLPTRHFWGGGE